MVVRPTIAEDIPGIVALIGEIWSEYGCFLDLENDDKHLLAPGPHFRTGGGEFWVVEEDGVVKATAAVLLYPDEAELKTLYVHPSLRRQGWGRRLVALAAEHARRAGKRRFLLWTDSRFLAAHAMYRNLGFQESGRRVMNDINHSTEIRFEMPLE